MTIQTQLVALKASVEKVIADTTTALKKKVASSFAANNALLLGGKTFAEIMSASQASAAAHIAGRNKHNTTAAQVGSYSTAQVQAALAQLLAAQYVPISRYGAPGTTIAPTTSGLNLTLKPVSCFLAGLYANLPQQVLSFAGYTNRTNYVYLEVSNGLLVYVIKTAKTPDTLTSMFLGTVVTSATAITSHTLTHLSRLDVCRMVTNANGSLGLVREV